MSQARVEHVPWGAFVFVTAVYGFALGAAAGVVWSTPRYALTWQFVGADLAATCVVFFFSRLANNTSIYDPYWSLAPLAQAAWLWAQLGGPPAWNSRPTLVLVLVACWSLRLTFNWARGWGGLTHEDWRYADFRRKTGRAYWGVSLFGLHLFPTLMTLLGGLALFPALWADGAPELNLLDALALALTGGAIALEAVADGQLRRFRRSPNAEGKVCDVGLWKWSRHPNYLGELLFWVGLSLFAAASDFWWAACLGPVAMLAMFLGASIPLAEKRSAARRPGWAAYAARTSRLLLWPPR